MATTTHDPINLAATQTYDEWALTLEGDVVTGLYAELPVLHPTKPLIDQMVEDLMACGTIEIDEMGRIVAPQEPTAYFFWSFQRYWIDAGIDNVSTNFDSELLRDWLWNRLPGPEALDQLARTAPVRTWLDSIAVPWFDSNDVALAGWVCSEADLQAAMHPPDEATREAEEVAAKADAAYYNAARVLGSMFAELTPEERAVVVYLHNTQGGALTHALALVAGACTPLEFAVGVLGAQGIFPAMPDVKAKRMAKQLRYIRDTAASALAYIAAYRASPSG